jgi:sialate O-acetylesterase
MKLDQHCWFVCLVVLFGAGHYSAAAVRLPRVFGDGMVLQRERSLPVWGWAQPGEKVTVRFAGQEASAAAGGDGAWMVRLNPLQADPRPRELTISAANTVVVKNVLVGDIWLVSGDFGAYWQVYAVADAANEVANANYPAMRLLKVEMKTSNTPLRDIQGEWLECNPKTVKGFSALAYFFGRELHHELKVPIGLIDCSYRYSYTRSWLAPEGIRMMPELQPMREKLDSWDSTTETGSKAFGATIAAVEKWLPEAERALREGTPIPPQPLVPAPITARDDNYNSIGELSVAYHGMVHPLIPFALRGMLWSQGENGGEWNSMDASLRALAGGWRKLWGQGDFPFFIEPLAQVGAPSPVPCAGDGWTGLREGQINSAAMANSGIVVTTDVSDYIADDRNRQDAGWRFALLALAKEYGRDVIYSGPVYKAQKIDGDTVTISFDHAGSGLMAGEKIGLAPAREAKDGILKHFAIAGADKKWQWADARIAGNTVVLRSDKVAAPLAVRYAWCSNPQPANLYNREGLPAVPFRTDNW